MDKLKQQESAASTIAVLMLENPSLWQEALEQAAAACSVRLDITLAKSLPQALSHLRQKAPEIILLSTNFPDGPSLDSLQSLSSQAPHIPILILGHAADESLVRELLAAGAQDYLSLSNGDAGRFISSIIFALERQKAYLHRQKRSLNEQREEFIALLAHDLKTPLIGANRAVEVLMGGAIGTVSEFQCKLLESLKNSNDRAVLHIDNLLEVYHYEQNAKQLYFENCDLQALLQECLQEIKPYLQEKALTMEHIFEPTLHSVMADKLELHRLFFNLLDNAVRFTSAGGCIKLTARNDKDSVVIEVEDNGPGIAEAEVSRLFQRFWQVVPGQSYSAGMGLGLYLCKKIVEAQQGKISCISKRGKGTTLTVVLPVSGVS